jgi:Kef-type K+ transport system membrane component KefB
MIIAGAVIGPNGFNLLLRDSGILLSGTAGLLYIMFLAGLEIDLAEFKKNALKSVTFGLYSFLIPIGIGTLVSFYIFDFQLLSSILCASMIASHTLLAYPMLSKMGVAKNRVVTVTVGGTMITDTLALLTLTVIVKLHGGTLEPRFWIQLAISLLIFALIVTLLFPPLTRWFFKRFHDNISQYIFVLVLLFTGAVLAHLAGVEPIIGAFLTGMALNRLIPSTSPLMNRIDFVGNAIFIPFFLIGVGMMVDYRVFFRGWETILVALVLALSSFTAKMFAAWLTQKTFRFTADERRVIFGLSGSQAAATLAIVTVGYNAGLLDDTVLNGSIIMILITCSIASLFAQKGGRELSIARSEQHDETGTSPADKILIALNKNENADELINWSHIIKSKDNKHGIYAVNVIPAAEHDTGANKRSADLLHKAAVHAAAADVYLNTFTRYDVSIANGIIGVIKENNISDLVLGLHETREKENSFMGTMTEKILARCEDTTLFIYKPVQPVATIKRHVLVLPARCEQEIGFPFWLSRIWNIARNSGVYLLFYGNQSTLKIIKEMNKKYPIEAEFRLFDDWHDFLIISRDLHKDDNLIIVLSRPGQISYQQNMTKLPHYLNKYFQANSFTLIYPMQNHLSNNPSYDPNDASMLTPVRTLEQMRKSLRKLFGN